MEKIKNTIKNHKKDAAIVVVTAVGSVLIYTLACKKAGFHMSKPGWVSPNNDTIYAKGVTGQTYVSKVVDVPPAA